MNKKRFLVDGNTGEILQEKDIILEEGEFPHEKKTIYPDELVVEKIRGKAISFQLGNITLFENEVDFFYYTYL